MFHLGVISTTFFIFIFIFFCRHHFVDLTSLMIMSGYLFLAPSFSLNIIFNLDWLITAERAEQLDRDPQPTECDEPSVRIF